MELTWLFYYFHNWERRSSQRKWKHINQRKKSAKSYFLESPYSGVFWAYFLLCTWEPLLAGVRGPYGLLRHEPRSALCSLLLYLSYSSFTNFSLGSLKWWSLSTPAFSVRIFHSTFPGGKTMFLLWSTDYKTQVTSINTVGFLLLIDVSHLLCSQTPDHEHLPVSCSSFIRIP